MGSDLIAKLIWIGIGIIFFVLVIVLGHMAMSSSKSSQTESQLSTIISNVQGLYANQPDFTGLSTATAISGGVIPSSMVSGTGTSATATDTYGGPVDVNVSSTNHDEFTVEFDNIPQHACVSIGSSISGSNLVSLTVNGTSVGSDVISPSYLATPCNNATNTMVWTFN